MSKKRRRKKGTEKYFAEKEENAVVEYINTDSIDRRHEIYNTILKKPFDRMIQSILRKYPIFHGNYDIHEIEANALSHLIEQMVKFNPDKINKQGKPVRAFSYCQTIVRNYYRDFGKKTYNDTKTNLSWEDYSSEVINRKEYLYEIDGDDMSDLEILMDKVVISMREKLVSMREKLDGDKSLKKNEIIVGEAIVCVLSNWHILFMEESPVGKINKKVTNKYQKNKILQLIKEQTDLNTKEIRMAMKPFKEIYYLEKKTFIEEDE